MDVSAVVCMVSLMSLVVLFAEGVDTNIGSIAGGSVVAVWSRLPSNTEVSTQGLLDLGRSFEGTSWSAANSLPLENFFPNSCCPIADTEKGSQFEN